MSKYSDKVIEEIPRTLLDHMKYHGSDFESVLVSFAPDGTWFLTGFGNKPFESMKTVSGVLAEAAELIAAEQETIH